MVYSAFKGLVVFDMTFRTVKSDIVWGRFKRAVPEWVDFPTQEQNIFFLCGYGLGQTKSIQFADGDLPAEIEGLKVYWQFAQSSTDYRAVWERFTECISTAVYNEWMIAYDQASQRDPRLLAEPELQANASDEPDVKKKRARTSAARHTLPQASGI